MVGPITVLHELQRRGFTPDDEGRDWADLPIGGAIRGGGGILSVPRYLVRVQDDDGLTIVYVMTGNGVLLWDVKLSGNTPLNIITAVIDLAIAHVVTLGADECE